MCRLRGAGPKRLGARPTSCRRRWGGCATTGPQDNSRCGPTAVSRPTPWSRLPQAEGPLLRHHPSARQLAKSHRSHTRDQLDAHTLVDGRRCRRVRNQLHSLPDRARRRAGAAHRPAVQTDPRLATGPVCQVQLPRLHHRPRRRAPGTGGRFNAAMPRSRMPSAISSTALVSTISARPAA